jgi:hypothetical protein
LKGKTYNHERIRRVDAETGIDILQLTSFPTMSHTIGYALSNFSREPSRLIFLSKRYPKRDAPLDLFIVGVDGSGLTQLTECDGLRSPNLSPDESETYFVRDSSLWRVSTGDFREEEIATFEGGKQNLGGLPLARWDRVLYRHGEGGEKSGLPRQYSRGVPRGGMGMKGDRCL